MNDKSQILTLFWHFLWFLKNLNFRALRTLEFFSTRTANAKKSIFVLLFGKCIYLQLLKKLALYNNSLSRKKHFSDARGQNDPPLGSTRVKKKKIRKKSKERIKKKNKKIMEKKNWKKNEKKNYEIIKL